VSHALNPREIHDGLDHPVIDVDGHLQEISTFFRDDVLEYAREFGGAALVDKVSKTPLTFDQEFTSQWFNLSPEERRDVWWPIRAWWAMPTNTRDRAASYLPGLLHERLEEIGIDFSVLYPSMGLSLPNIADPDVRQVACRVYNTMNAELYRPYADRMTPVAVIPMHTPDEAIHVLEHAVLELGSKAIVCGHVKRPVPKVEREMPEAARWADRLDTLGIDSDYNYDAFWQRCVDLRVAVGMHSSEQGWGSRRSVSRYVYNHVGAFAAACESLCKSLFMGGVTKRFPDLNFVFLEGGIGWACSLFNDLVGHWEKRNKDAIKNLDPANLDVDLMAELFDKYGSGRYKSDLDGIRGYFTRPDGHPDDLNDWRDTGIEQIQDFRELFVEPFYFGCEADDPLNVLAFDTDINPLGSRLQAVFGSDLGHWDVTDLSGVLGEAYEMVEDERISIDDFRDFVFTNPGHLYLDSNPDFFKGTSVEEAVADITR
jgi:predicted TIM-barrel fold metal-dependent hydrolase